MRHQLALACTCGKLRGVATDLSPRTGTHLVCMCDDCQCYAHYLERADEILDANGGTEVFQLTPAQIEIHQGSEHLRCVRLGPKGLMRWHTGCCRTPVANTLASPKVPFAGLVRQWVDPSVDEAHLLTAWGPVLDRTQARFGRGPFPENTSQRASLGVIWHAMKVMAGGWLRRRHQPSPFFDASTGRPIVEPTVLSLEEREELRQRIRIGADSA